MPSEGLSSFSRILRISFFKVALRGNFFFARNFPPPVMARAVEAIVCLSCVISSAWTGNRKQSDWKVVWI